MILKSFIKLMIKLFQTGKGKSKIVILKSKNDKNIYPKTMERIQFDRLW
jgi:hypothetical protein